MYFCSAEQQVLKLSECEQQRNSYPSLQSTNATSANRD